MKNKFLIIFLLLSVFACNSKQSQCLKKGDTYTTSPSSEITNGSKCDDGCDDVVTSGDASTGYSTHTCFSKTCVSEGNSKTAGELCCNDLLSKDNVCIKSSDCKFDGITGMVINSETQKTCIEQENCVSSGLATYSDCQRCCVGTSKLVSMTTGNYNPIYCLANGETIPEEYEYMFSHSEPVLVTTDDEKEWEENCLP